MPRYLRRDPFPLFQLEEIKHRCLRPLAITLHESHLLMRHHQRDESRLRTSIPYACTRFTDRITRLELRSPCRP
ncbi:unnamed protein product [Linum trigynum]|uniref:Uncharacterized protein n=1 Tax=Linum trigynum TaxID=586398 RepID=A0AAV2EU29_9ROSI